MDEIKALKVKIYCFFGAGISALIAIIAIVLKMAKVVTDTDGWLFWGIGMGLWIVLMIFGFAIKKD